MPETTWIKMCCLFKKTSPKFLQSLLASESVCGAMQRWHMFLMSFKKQQDSSQYKKIKTFKVIMFYPWPAFQNCNFNTEIIFKCVFWYFYMVLHLELEVKMKRSPLFRMSITEEILSEFQQACIWPSTYTWSQSFPGGLYLADVFQF